MTKHFIKLLKENMQLHVFALVQIHVWGKHLCRYCCLWYSWIISLWGEMSVESKTLINKDMHALAIITLQVLENMAHISFSSRLKTVFINTGNLNFIHSHHFIIPCWATSRNINKKGTTFWTDSSSFSMTGRSPDFKHQDSKPPGLEILYRLVWWDVKAH